MPIPTALEIHRQGRTLVKTPISSEDWAYQLQGGLEFQLAGRPLAAGRLALAANRLCFRRLYQ